MEQITSIILESGRVAVDLALYVLLPIMVVMLALMRLLEAKGVLNWLAAHLSPLLKPFGIPGIGIFAALQLLFISFAAPIASFTLMQQNGTAKRAIAATLAMILTMSQANVVFPMTTVGLNLPFIMLTSLIGGLIAAVTTFYWFANQHHEALPTQEFIPQPSSQTEQQNFIQIMAEGGQDGLKIVLASLPMLILALTFVNVLEATAAITLISNVLAPILALINLPEATVLPLVTKFIAGGTAFMSVTLDLMQQDLISAAELNRMAGFAVNSFDVVGVALFAAAGSRVASVVKAAMLGATIGIIVRGSLHLLVF